MTVRDDVSGLPAGAHLSCARHVRLLRATFASNGRGHHVRVQMGPVVKVGVHADARVHTSHVRTELSRERMGL